MPDKAAHSAPGNQCQRIRVAQNGVAAVDLCNCGVFHVHVGALTLRMEPPAVQELLAALRAALAHGSSEASLEDDAIMNALRGGGHGRA